MNLTDIATLRLVSQQIAEPRLKTAKAIVEWMGAIQAQDYSMAKWAIGVRLPNSTDQMIETSINNGEIIRTHLLRPTWHLASQDDIYWMLDLTAPRIKSVLKSRHNELELTENIVLKSNAIIENALMGGKQLTREELEAELIKAKIATINNRGYHLVVWAELEGLVCSGATKGGKHTYALLEERVKRAKTVTREEALAKLARKYFTSHGPASVQDFVWWSGLSVSDAKYALEMVKSEFVSESVGSQTYWLADSFSLPTNDRESVYLLPAFDEFIISYRDRSASLPLTSFNKTVSNNGIFRPVIVVNGQVAGVWKRTIKKDKVIVETQLFEQADRNLKTLIERASMQFGNFLAKQTDVNHIF